MNLQNRMTRGRGRGGVNQTRGGGRQANTRDRRYNIRNVGQTSEPADNIDTGDQNQPTVVKKPTTATSTQNTCAPRNRRPSSILPANEKPKAEPAVPEASIENDPDYLYRSKIPVKDPKIGHGVRYNPNDPNAKIPVTKIYVSRFAENVRGEKLKEVFSQYGPVRDVQIRVKNKHTFAFLTYEHHRDALKALSSETLVGKKKVYVDEADTKYQPKPTHIDKLAAITAPDKCSIVKLNDDCLRHIFSYLNLVTRTKVEVVCKCWHRLSRNMWLVVRSLNFCTPPLSTFLTEATSLYDFTAKQLTSYTGHNLSSLTIKKFLSPDTLKVVRDNCTALERLTLVRFTLHDSKVVMPSLKTLKHLSLDTCTISDKLQNKMFSVAKCLESVAATRHAGDTNFMEYLSHMTAFALTQCDVKHNHFTKFLTRNGQGLRTLSLTKCPLDEEMYDGAVELMAKHAPKLECLSLDKFNRTTDVLKLTSLYKLTCLTSLSLCYNNGLNGDILTKVIRNCKGLQTVSLDSTSGLTSESIAALGKLNQLKSLSLCNISEANGLNNEAIIGLVNNLVNAASFQHLGVANTGLSDEALYAVLTLCPGLESLNVVGCQRITEASLMTAEEAVVARTQPPLSLALSIESTALRTAVDEATAVGKKFHPRLIFTESPIKAKPEWARLNPWADSDDLNTDDSDDDDEDLMGNLDLVDSDDEYMYLMGLGVDGLDFENGIVDLDEYIGMRLGGVHLGSDSDLSDDDYYPVF